MYYVRCVYRVLYVRSIYYGKSECELCKGSAVSMSERNGGTKGRERTPLCYIPPTFSSTQSSELRGWRLLFNAVESKFALLEMPVA
jgi:hypothetical protein